MLILKAYETIKCIVENGSYIYNKDAHIIIIIKLHVGTHENV